MKSFLGYIKYEIGQLRKNVRDPRMMFSGFLLFVIIVFLVANHFVFATTPNPGHPWTDLGNGFWQVANTQTSLRTFTFPDASANVLTDNAAVTLAQGGTGLTTFPINSFVVSNNAGTALSATSTSPMYVGSLVATTTATSTHGGPISSISGNLIIGSAGTTNNLLFNPYGGSIGVGSSTPSTTFGVVGSGYFTSGLGIGLLNTTAGTIQTSGAATIGGTLAVTGQTTLATALTGPLQALLGVVSATSTVSVFYGGTGTTSPTKNGVLIGNTTNNLLVITPTSATGTLISSTGGANAVCAAVNPPNPVLFTSVGLHAANLTTVTAMTSGTSAFQYMGVSPVSYGMCTIIQNVTTAAVTITWAEVAIFSGTPVINGNASLTRLGFTSVAGTYNGTGRLKTIVTAAIPSGTPMWVAYASSATTPFQVRGLLADDPQTGVFQTAVIRPSLASSPQAVTLASAVLVPAWTSMTCQ